MTKRATQIRKDGIRLSWTQEETDFAFECLTAGMSAFVTAMAMTDKGMRSDCSPVTRNAIVGVWNRDPERKKKCRSKDGDNQPAIKKSKGIENKISGLLFGVKTSYKPVPPTKPKIYIPPEDGVAFMDLKNMMCRFPYGEGLENIRYCGHPVEFEKTKSYCKTHFRICYQQKR